MRKNEAAFPFFPNGYDAECGLTVREYFAAAAMQGIWANHYAFDSQTKQDPDQVAAWAVASADALIAALAKDTKEKP